MGMLYDVLTELAPAHDAELADGYRRYEALLATILSPDQLQAYAAAIRQSGVVRIFEELTPDEFAALSPEERAIGMAIKADENISMENRRVVALLNQRGEHAAAPDLGVSPQHV